MSPPWPVADRRESPWNALRAHSKGVADFRTIRPSKVRRVMQQASSEETSVGEYLFEFSHLLYKFPIQLEIR